MRIHPVVLCGGSGTRLWPLSRAAVPKQLLSLTSERSLLQETVARCAGLESAGPPLAICNEEHRFLVAEQFRELGVRPHRLFLEPAGRSTAPAIAIAALALEHEDPEALMLVLPADHRVGGRKAFEEAVCRAAPAAGEGWLVTFGVVPDAPETGYGYIRRGPALEHHAGCHRVERFVEKPDRVRAEGFLEEGGYFWNSGIFLFSVRAYLAELERQRPVMLAACRRALAEGGPDLDFHRLGAEAFAACPAESVDYAVMEGTERAAVLPVDMGWSDVGSWDALWQVAEKDGDGNAVAGDVFLRGVSNSYVRTENRFVAALGVEDLVIVDTPDAVLVAARERVQEVKEVVKHLRSNGRSEHQTHTRVFRPWGWYEGIDAGERFQVKRIMVKPGARLSLQMHHHRAEHWVVVSGTARVTCGDRQMLLAENQSTYIPLGVSHRLENPGKVPLHIIEAQSGCYLGEDDIVRFDDTYGRADQDSAAAS